MNNRNTRERCEICLKITIKTPERHQLCCSGVFIFNFEHILDLFRVLLLLPLDKQILGEFANPARALFRFPINLYFAQKLFCVRHKNRQKHNQDFKLLFFTTH